MEPDPFLTIDEDGQPLYDWVPETGFPEVAPECGIYYQEAPPINSWYMRGPMAFINTGKHQLSAAVAWSLFTDALAISSSLACKI
jgi:hypothetical protein